MNENLPVWMSNLLIGLWIYCLAMMNKFSPSVLSRLQRQTNKIKEKDCSLHTVRNDLISMLKNKQPAMLTMRNGNLNLQSQSDREIYLYSCLGLVCISADIG